MTFTKGPNLNLRTQIAEEESQKYKFRIENKESIILLQIKKSVITFIDYELNFSLHTAAAVGRVQTFDEKEI